MKEQTKNLIASILGFILGTLIAAGIIFFIVIGFSIIFGIIPTNKSVEMEGSEPIGPGGGGGQVTYDMNMTDYNYTLVPTGETYNGAFKTEFWYGNRS